MKVYIQDRNIFNDIELQGLDNNQSMLFLYTLLDQPEALDRLLYSSNNSYKLVNTLTNKSQFNALFLSQSKECTKILLKYGINFTHIDLDDEIALAHIASYNSKEEVELLINLYYENDILPPINIPVGADGRTILHHAVINGNYEVVNYLLNETISDPIIKDNFGDSATNYAQENGLAPLFTLFREENKLSKPEYVLGYGSSILCNI